MNYSVVRASSSPLPLARKYFTSCSHSCSGPSVMSCKAVDSPSPAALSVPASSAEQPSSRGPSDRALLSALQSTSLAHPPDA
jgi:hypothetical protein